MGYIYKVYNRLPAKNLLKKMAWHIPTPYLYPPTFRKYYRFLTKSQWWSQDDLKAYQFRQLIKLLEYANNKVPYYKKIFKKNNIYPSKFKSLEDIKRIPFLTKDIIRNHFEELQSEDKKFWKPMVLSTGGSSGESLQFMSSMYTSSIRKAAKWRANNWATYNFEDKGLTFLRPYLGISDGQYRCKKNIKDKQIDLNITQFNTESLGYLLKKLVEYKPRVIESYPSRLFLLCKFLKENEFNLSSIQVVITSSEMLYKPQREEIQNLFDCKVFDEYGQMEFTVYSAQCEKGSYHLSSELHLVELMKNNEDSALKGEVGEVVGTSFVNHVMPFIRYKTGDLAIQDEEYKCSCGRGLPTLRNIIGRANDIIITPKGAITFPHSLFEFHLLNGIDDLQIIQEKINFLRVKVVINEAYTEKTKQMLVNMLKKKLNFSFKISVVPVKEIRRTLFDKYKLVVSKIKNSS